MFLHCKYSFSVCKHGSILIIALMSGKATTVCILCSKSGYML